MLDWERGGNISVVGMDMAVFLWDELNCNVC